MCTSQKGELFSVYRRGDLVSMSAVTEWEVRLGCSALSATPTAALEQQNSLTREGEVPYERSAPGLDTTTPNGQRRLA